MNFPSKLVEAAVNQLASLPGIGKKTALRLVLHLLKNEKIRVEQFGASFINLIQNINYCKDCKDCADGKDCKDGKDGKDGKDC